MDGRKIELKPCPFCGGRADLKIKRILSGQGEAGFDFTIRCGKCEIEIPKIYRVTFTLGMRGEINAIIDEREMAMNDWNRRHE